MTSSVLDGVGDMQSPAPPAFSPLTAPSPDSGNREPSVHESIMLDQTENPESANSAPIAAAAALFAPEPDNPASSFPNALFLQQAANGDDGSNNNNNTTTTPITGTMIPPGLGVAMYDATPIIPPLEEAGMDFTTAQALSLFPQPDPLSVLTATLMKLKQQNVQQPSTIRPSQVSMSAMLDSMPNNDPSADIVPPSNPPPAAADTPLESFARIEFADSVFQMTTYSVIIGRDQRAMKQALRDEKAEQAWEREKAALEAAGYAPPERPVSITNKYSKSYVSVEGGMLGPASDGEGGSDRPAKRRKLSRPASASGNANEQRRQSATAFEQAATEDKNTVANRQYVSHTPGAVPVDISALMPSPNYCPFIGIHSPGPNIAAKTKAISREHMKIEYDQKAGVFKAIPLHKNGFFIEDVHHKDEPVVLKSGTHIQIKDVELTFIINGVPFGQTGIEKVEQPAKNRRYSEGGKEMSFDFEDTRDLDRGSTSPEMVAADQANHYESDSELSELDEIPEPMEVDGVAGPEVMKTIENDDDDHEDDDHEEQDHEQQQQNIKPGGMTLEMQAGFPSVPPKKRGPGRPPKNGVMSKREERLMKKAALEAAKKNIPPATPGEPPVKRKVGRPRKHPLPEETPDRPEKRKYKPRKLKNGEEGEEGSDLEKTIKERRREKPKTPPLELDREDYTEEQLQKPTKNYGILIDEVLNAEPGGLSLKQIYKRIQMRYPFYYFAVDTKGWESSVRHNLIGNDAFRKDGQTHLWHRVPGIDIDAGKKRKAVSPEHSASLHTFGQHYQGPPAPQGQMFHAEAGTQQGYRPSTAAQRAGYPAVHGQVNLGQHPHQHLSTQPVGPGLQQQTAQRPPYQAPPQAQGAALAAGYGEQQSGTRQLPPNAQAAAYPSPYSSKPPPAVAANQAAGVPQNAPRPGTQPHPVPGPYNGLPRMSTVSPHPGAPAIARQGQQSAVTNGAPVPLKPAVSPELAKYIENFKKTAAGLLQGRTSNVEMVLMSVINRGLGLAAQSLLNEEDKLENIVLGVFESTISKNFEENGKLHPDLVKALVEFKTTWSKVLEPKLGDKLQAERLILSATNRALGFCDKSWNPEKYSEPEKVLIPGIADVIRKHQNTLAVLSATHSPAVATPPAPRAPMSTPSRPSYSTPGPSNQNTMARPPLPNPAATSRQPPAGQPTKQQPAQPVSRAAWTPGHTAPQAPGQSSAQALMRAATVAAPQMQQAINQGAATSARPIAPIAPHPQVRTMTQAASILNSPTPHALAQSLAAAKSQVPAQGMQPLQNQARVQAPSTQTSQASQPRIGPTQPLPAQATAYTRQTRPGPVQGPPQERPPQSVAQPKAQPIAQQGAHNVTQQGAQQGAQAAAQPMLPQINTQSMAPAAISIAAPQTSSQAPSAQPLPCSEAQVSQAPLTSVSAQVQSSLPAQVQPLASVHQSPALARQSPASAQVESPARTVSQPSGPSRLPPKPLVPEPCLAPISPSVSQSTTPVPNVATSSPRVANTSPQTVARPPSAQGQPQAYTQVPPRTFVQNSNQIAGGKQIQTPTQSSAPSSTASQTAAQLSDPAAVQGKTQGHGQQNVNTSQTTTSLPANTSQTQSPTQSTLPKPVVTATAPVASMAMSAPTPPINPAQQSPAAPAPAATVAR